MTNSKSLKYRIKSLYDNKMGLDGTTSGEVATGVAGSKIIHMGYSGVGIYNPYKSFIIEEV